VDAIYVQEHIPQLPGRGAALRDADEPAERVRTFGCFVPQATQGKMGHVMKARMVVRPLGRTRPFGDDVGHVVGADVRRDVFDDDLAAEVIDADLGLKPPLGSTVSGLNGCHAR
jgi:hypothetical protein